MQTRAWKFWESIPCQWKNTMNNQIYLAMVYMYVHITGKDKRILYFPYVCTKFNVIQRWNFSLILSNLKMAAYMIYSHYPRRAEHYLKTSTIINVIMLFLVWTYCHTCKWYVQSDLQSLKWWLFITQCTSGHLNVMLTE